MNIYLTADWHLFHENIIKYCNRPFNNVKEMHKRLVDEYKRKVTNKDVVFFIGDMGFYKPEEIRKIVEPLKGKKILVLGNHDKYGVSTYYRMGFHVVVNSATIKVGKRIFNIEHIPRRSLSELYRLFKVYIREGRLRKRPWKQIYYRLRKEWNKHKRPDGNWTICGHVHEAWLMKRKNINIGVDKWNFTPVHIQKIVRLIDQHESNG